MGNALRFLYGKCCTPHDQDALGPHGVTSSNVGVSALAHDILHFDVTSQVPDRLSQYVVSSKKAQANWYRKLSEAWKETKPPPKSPEEASRLVVATLKRHQRADVQGLLLYYGLPSLQNIGETTPGGDDYTPSLPPGVQYEIETLPVDAKAVADGDTITAYVDTADPMESGKVPMEVRTAVEKRSRARAVKNYNQADALQKVITDAGYRVINGPNNEETLARKYRIRLRGIDAPESQMPFGKEAKEALTKLVQGKRLKIQIYDVDRYGRSVGDIYCSSTFVQEFMLKKGFAWHYEAYDKRPQFAEWEKQARSARRGLWAARNPQKPWEWRKDKRNGA